MYNVEYLAIGTFVITITLIITRPHKMRLGVAAGIGALTSIVLGITTVFDALMALADIWDAALAFLGIVLLSVVLDAVGFFRWAALRVVLLARGDGIRLYFYVTIFTVCISILFANDSAILILTPIVIEIVRALKLSVDSSRAYLFGVGLIADTASMPLITSNPVNIVSADYFGYTFLQHLMLMGIVGVITTAQSMIFLFLYYRRKIPREYSTEPVERLVRENHRPPFLRASIATLVIIDVGYVIASLNRVPVSFVILTGAMSLFILYCMRYLSAIRNGDRSDASPVRIVQRVNWDILVFMIAIYLVVYGLHHTGVSTALSALLYETCLLPSVLSAIIPSLVVTVGASAINNWPMTMLSVMSIENTISAFTLGEHSITILVFANIIGNNLGPHFFPFGSLAILMWLDITRRGGLTITLREYLRIGSVLSIIETLTASVVLWIEVMVFGMTLVLAG